MKNEEKTLYWGYEIRKVPEIGRRIPLIRVEVGGCSIGVWLEKKSIETEPIQEIQKLGSNMSILWTEKEGYIVYW